MTNTIGAFNLHDVETLARQRMDPAAYDFFAGGAEDERTLAENRAAFTRVTLRPRVLVDVSALDASVEILGVRLACPVFLAPTALNRLAHPDGEREAARAAAKCGSLLVVSTNASTSLEEISRAAPGPLWFQLYIHRDRGFTSDLIKRAEASGYGALMLTVDAPRLGRRERDLRNRFSLPSDITTVNLAPLGGGPPRHGTRPRYDEEVANQFDASMTWDIVPWLQSQTKLPVLLKGILSPEDADRAVQAGVAGIVVSNHGGRQLDGAIATIDALPAIADVVDERIPVVLDGGIRRGTDVVKAIALGAAAVMIGRPYLWGLAAAGEAGVCRVLDLLHDELLSAMALCGCPTVKAITRSLVVRT